MEYSYVNPEQKQNRAPKKKVKQGVRVGLAVLLSCVMIATVIGLFAGVLLTNRLLLTREQTASANTIPAAPSQAPSAVASAAPSASSQDAVSQSAAAGNAGFAYTGLYTRAQIIELAAPSVVGIDIVTPVTYWGRTYEAEGSGSGVILSNDGYIATCAHVVENASKIKVTLNDDTSYEATVVGADKRNDLAIIKVEASGLIAAEIGDSDMLTVGEDVIAIGNPLGELRGTATSGIVSALRRPVNVEGTEMELVQTDAAISPGNSGGGLFNASGKLIGIVNAKASGNNAEGLGFAIPVNNVIGEINDLLHYGYVTGRAYLGVYTQNVTLRSDYGFWQFNTVSCVQVADVVSGGAAEQAGIRIGDLILSVDGKEVTSNIALSDLISAYNAGDTATITLQRDGKQLEVQVTFGEYVPQK